jgi:glycosyltransferase involved in cell wall biosynthesis
MGGAYLCEAILKLSLAMIVLNTEATIGKCLESVKDVVDEIVIVDTGSTDKTIEIVSKYTNKIFHFKWINDFSAARNYSFDQCTGDFILWLDGDDYVLPEDVEKIKKLDYSDKEIIICNYEYAHDEFGKSICTVPRERIVKRSLGLRWEEPIHEYLPLKFHTFNSDISVHHNKQHGTSERNLELLEKIVSSQEIPSSRNLYYLGKEYLEFNRPDDAIKYLKLFVAREDAFWEDVYQAHYRLALCYMSKDDTKFKEHIYESLKIEEQWAEPYYLMGLFYMNKSNWRKAIHWFELCLNVKRGKDLLTTFQPDYSTWLPALNLCVCYNSIGDLEKAREFNKLALKYRPSDSRMLHNEQLLNIKKDGAGKKLNLGSGDKAMPGYVNVDLFKGPIVDEIFQFDDIPYKDASISGIHSEHSLEHVPFARVEKALNEWYRVLTPGGELLLKMPDFDDCCRKYIESVDKKARWWYKCTIYGVQISQAGEPNEAQIHMCGFSRGEMQEVLERIGFVMDYNVPYDGWNTPSFGIRAIKPVMPLKIGWICPPIWEAAQSRIRVLLVDRWLRSRGYRSQVVDYSDIVEKNYDIAIIGKGFTEDSYNKVRWLKENGKLVYCDMCESVIEYPYVKETMALCDRVICCSQSLADLYSTVNPNVMVIEDSYET